MKIGIVGAGFIGRAIARLAIAAGHQAMVSNSRGPRSLASIPSGIDELGFDPVDAGGLADSWRFERGTPVYCLQLDRGALVAGLAPAERTKDVVNGF